MTDISLAQIDTNLLVALDLLLKEKSVSRAAERSYVSQPAMSNTLKRLRNLFNDPLLVKVKGGMKLTPYAQQIAVPLHQALLQLQAVITQPPEFDPATAKAQFKLAFLDYGTSVFLPRIIEHCAHHAPGVHVIVRSTPPHECYRALEEGEIDLGVGVFPRPPANATSELLYKEHFMSVVREDHPILDNPITLEQYTSYPHGLVSTRGEGEGAVDIELIKLGYQREVAVRVPFFLSVPSLLQSSSLIFTLPSRIAHWMIANHPVQTFEPPLELPQFSIELIWHRRLEQEPGNQWMRQFIRTLV